MLLLFLAVMAIRVCFYWLVLGSGIIGSDKWVIVCFYIVV